ncbi:TIR domain-containing protein [Flammeovirgaceae bacterium SG7u.111]|nr:TIR domain-containing protein [Flammeovirgaceae bacterium SG7u.132]WPO36237.1 TIR domain-containing protein [Flammeovirgaceae bacterium SG7u.111]
MPSIQELKQLIANGELEKAVKELLVATEGTDIHSDITHQSARLNKALKDERMGIARTDDTNRTKNQITYALLSYLDDNSELFEHQPTQTSAMQPSSSSSQGKRVFISYNHKDKEVAQQVKAKLEEAGLTVTIDSEAMGAGEDIKSFIEKCVRENDVTLSLVSPNSLLSAWVAMESQLTLTGERIANKKFIGCAIDNSFFGRGFVDDALDKVEDELAEISQLMQKRLNRGRGVEDLQNELSRYKQLESNLPEIVRKFKESLTVDISGDNFEAGMGKVIGTIG